MIIFMAELVQIDYMDKLIMITFMEELVQTTYTDKKEMID